MYNVSLHGDSASKKGNSWLKIINGWCQTYVKAIHKTLGTSLLQI